MRICANPLCILYRLDRSSSSREQLHIYFVSGVLKQVSMGKYIEDPQIECDSSDFRDMHRLQVRHEGIAGKAMPMRA